MDPIATVAGRLRAARRLVARHPRRAQVAAVWAVAAAVGSIAWSQVIVRGDAGTAPAEAAAVAGGPPGRALPAAGAERVWTVGLRDRTVRVFDAPSLAPAGPPRRIGADGDEAAHAVAHAGGLWVALQRGGRGLLARVGPDGRVARVLGAGYLRPRRIAALPGRVIVLGDARVGAVATGGRGWTRALPDAVDVAVGYGSVWALSAHEDARSLVTRLDPATGRVTGRRVAPAAATAIAVGMGAVWLANGCANGVLRAPVGAGPGRCIPVNKGPGDVAVGAGGVWAADGPGSRVVRLDPATGAPLRAWRVPGRPAEVAAGGAGAVATTRRGGLVRLG